MAIKKGSPSAVAANVFSVEASTGIMTLLNTKLRMTGHHLSSQAPGATFWTTYAGTPVSDSGSNGTVYMPVISAKEMRVVTHGVAGDDPEVEGDFTHEWGGTDYDYNTVPNQGYMASALYYKTGSIAATQPVTFTIHRGHDDTGPLVYSQAYPASKFPANSEVKIDLPILDYSEGAEFHGMLMSTANFSLITNADFSQPWRAVDRQKEEHVALLPADLVFPTIVQSSPAAGAVGVSLTPTMSAAKGTYVATKTLDYDVSKTEVQIRRASDQVIVSDRSLDGAVDVPTLINLAGVTQHHWRARHEINKDGRVIPLPWGSWQTFKTTFFVNINIRTTVTRNSIVLNLAAGDLIELNVGESVNASGFQFHLSGEAIEFPPAAYDSGGLRFRDDLGTELNFMVYSLTGSAPNRTAKCLIEMNARTISTAKVVLVEVP